MTYSLQFTERMVGAFAFAETNYDAGYQAGMRDGAALEFRLTIATDDVEALIADPEHSAVPTGYVGCDALGGRRQVLEGTFDLFVDEPKRIRHMLYRLYFSDSTGRPLTLAGFKDVRPAPLAAVWPETSTLYTRILSGHVPVPDGGSEVTEGIVGSGILRIPSHRLCLAAHHNARAWPYVARSYQSLRELRQALFRRAMASLRPPAPQAPSWLTSASSSSPTSTSALRTVCLRL